MNPAKLIIACRDEEKGMAALAEIRTSTGSQNTELWQVDLADFASVKAFAERFQRECDRLDILIMNAAVLARQYEETVNGWELSLQVNHLAGALMALLLLPHMVETGRKFGTSPRLVFVSSDVHYWASFPEDAKRSLCPIATLSSEDYRDQKSMKYRYLDTKLMNVLFSRVLQDRLPSATPLTVNAVNPGICVSSLRRNEPQSLFVRTAYFVMEAVLAWTAEQGSRQLVYAAVGQQDNEERMKGTFINACAVAEPADFVLSEEGKQMQDALWRETVGILTKEAPQLESIIGEYLT